MTKFFDAVDSFFETYLSGLLGWVATAALVIVVMILDYTTHSTTAMLLLAVPGIYMMGRSGGVVQIVKFGLCTVLVIFVLAMAVNQIPCNDFGKGFLMFYGMKCN